jgi:hypothetical protein
MTEVGALDIDTAVVPIGEHGYRADRSRDGEIWGPSGGYLAAIALGAAGASTPLRRPASFAGHFLGVAEFGPVTLTVRPVRVTRCVTSLAVSMARASGRSSKRWSGWSATPTASSTWRGAPRGPGTP